MQMNITGLTMLNTKLYMLHDELDSGSKSTYSEEMEARVHFQQDFIKEYTKMITHYQTWYQFVTEDHIEKVDELALPPLFES